VRSTRKLVTKSHACVQIGNLDFRVAATCGVEAGAVERCSQRPRHEARDGAGKRGRIGDVSPGNRCPRIRLWFGKMPGSVVHSCDMTNMQVYFCGYSRDRRIPSPFSWP